MSTWEYTQIREDGRMGWRRFVPHGVLFAAEPEDPEDTGALDPDPGCWEWWSINSDGDIEYLLQSDENAEWSTIEHVKAACDAEHLNTMAKTPLDELLTVHVGEDYVVVMFPSEGTDDASITVHGSAAAVVASEIAARWNSARRTS